MSITMVSNSTCVTYAYLQHRHACVHIDTGMLGSTSRTKHCSGPVALQVRPQGLKQVRRVRQGAKLPTGSSARLVGVGARNCQSRAAQSNY